MRKLITPLAISAALLFASQNSFAQNVGINTQQPDPSAALDIVGTDKGLLIPRVSLQSLIDNVTVPNPANALLIYNTNAAIGKAGFYYNSGTSQSPIWSPIGDLALPYAKTGNGPGAAFFIENTNDAPTSSAITGNSVDAIGLRGVSQNGRGVVGSAISNGIGVFASSANTNGTALEVSGPVKISGPGQSPGNGKVLMSDGSGNATWENISGNVAFRASGILGGGNQIIPLHSEIKVAFANEAYDLGSNYNNSNQTPHSTFIAPSDGIYHFDASVGSACGSGCDFKTRLNLILTRNGSSSIIEQTGAYGGGQTFNFLSVDVALNQGDLLHLQLIYDTSTTSENIIMQSGNFNGRLVIPE
ncbi:hypothetical protein [Dyadobacter fanqingshengii]|uniref:C1q domain-containing protein n=1 Tax=Dyadobacter fanqingshengii TaxID=2906443 RepID=A0A9X1TF03_9BACT|nr:hypothetical protein [Dyadobacter fanqingshengii]MCF0039037.1 hypothetical protein [Dyadobacter fanqingshengii]USJ34141.1 hypothetical protein NFI81_15655 [Dyadobacter fanqingshengii]